MTDGTQSPSTPDIDLMAPIHTHKETEFLTSSDGFSRSIQYLMNTFPKLCDSLALLHTASALHNMSDGDVNSLFAPTLEDIQESMSNYDAKHEVANQYVRPNETILQSWEITFAMKVNSDYFLPRNEFRQYLHQSMRFTSDISGFFDIIGEEIDVTNAISDFNLLSIHSRKNRDGTMYRECGSFNSNLQDYDLLFYMRDIDMQQIAPAGIHSVTPSDLQLSFIEYIIQKVKLIEQMGPLEQEMKQGGEIINKLMTMFIQPYAHLVAQYDHIHGISDGNMNNYNFQTGESTRQAAVDASDPYFLGTRPEVPKDYVEPHKPQHKEDTSDFTSIEIE